MSTPTEGFLDQIITWIVGAISFVAIWVWTTTMGRISRLEEGKVSMKAFEEYTQRADKDRDERRETELTLFNKVDDLRNHIDVKIDRIADLIRSNK